MPDARTPPDPAFDFVVIGGGAAGFFAAARAAGLAPADARIAILEQGPRPLQKVRISGGGRCNLTHAEFDPRALARHYPRGARELLGPLHRFGPGDTLAWFADRGVDTVTEADGRVFPRSNTSASVIGALLDEVRARGVQLLTSAKVLDLTRRDGGFAVRLKTRVLHARNVLLATGSAPRAYEWLRDLGAPIVPPVPSLFSLNIPSPALHECQGLSVGDALVRVRGFPATSRGSLLVTHWGLSGPAVLKLSALAARHLHARDYRTDATVSWTGDSVEAVAAYLQAARRQAGGTTVARALGLPLPRRLWGYLLSRAGLRPTARWADASKADLRALATAVAADVYPVRGQTRFKDEFVTAGGLDLRAVDFRTFELRGVPGLFAAGEVLDVDGVTGGFNFQAAWTGGYLAGTAVGERLAAAAAST